MGGDKPVTVGCGENEASETKPQDLALEASETKPQDLALEASRLFRWVCRPV